jgi:hypothetical protein
LSFSFGDFLLVYVKTVQVMTPFHGSVLSKLLGGGHFQNPPSIPLLTVVRLACWIRKAAFVIDWHNFGYTILALSLGSSHPLVKIYFWCLSHLFKLFVALYYITLILCSFLFLFFKTLFCTWFLVMGGGYMHTVACDAFLLQCQILKGSWMFCFKLHDAQAIIYRYERGYGKMANGHLCVTKAMQHELAQNWGIRYVPTGKRPWT